VIAFWGYCQLTKTQFNNTGQADIVLMASLCQSYVLTVMILSNLIALPSKKIRINTKPVSVINAYTTMLKYLSNLRTVCDYRKQKANGMFTVYI